MAYKPFSRILFLALSAFAVVVSVLAAPFVVAVFPFLDSTAQAFATSPLVSALVSAVFWTAVVALVLSAVLAVRWTFVRAHRQRWAQAVRNYPVDPSIISAGSRIA